MHQIKITKIKFTLGGNMALLRKKLAYEFLPTKNKKILEVDTLLAGH